LPTKSLNLETIKAKPVEILKSAESKGLFHDESSKKFIHSFDDNKKYLYYEQDKMGEMSIADFMSKPMKSGILNIKLNKNNTVSQSIPDEFLYTENDFVGEGIKDIVRRNVKYLETLYPKSKVIGSPALIDTKGFNRIPNDYDLTTLNIKNINGFKPIDGKAKYGKTFMYQNQEIDVNSALHDDYARDLSKFLEAQGFKKYPLQNNSSHVKANFKHLDATQKTLFDKSQSIKEKHIEDFNNLLINGNGKEVLKTIELRNKVLFKDLKMPVLDLKNIETNKSILKKIEFNNYIDEIAADENKMKAVILDYYIKQTSYGRGVSAVDGKKLYTLIKIQLMEVKFMD